MQDGSHQSGTSQTDRLAPSRGLDSWFSSDEVKGSRKQRGEFSAHEETETDRASQTISKNCETQTAGSLGVSGSKRSDILGSQECEAAKRFLEFTQWMIIHEVNPQSGEQMDMILVEASRGINDGVRIVAATRFFQAHWAKDLVRPARALKGWQQAAPPRRRMPIALEVMGALVGWFLQLGHPEMAMRMFLQFITYMRPGECSQLTCKQLVRPQKARSQSFSFWAILLHPAEDLVPGKTGIFDSSVILDSDTWMEEFLENLVAKRSGNDPLWKNSRSEFRGIFNQLIVLMKLEPLGLTLYALRHGGATHDVLSRRRTMLEVKQRGRWSADSSLKRYVKEARLQTELAKVPEAVKQFGMAVLARLPDFLRSPRLMPKHRLERSFN